MSDYKICHECNSKMYKKKGLKFGVIIEYYQCEKCGEIVYDSEAVKKIEELNKGEGALNEE